MDIEQIKKINEMTKTLQNHGIAESSEDGSSLASTMEEKPLPENAPREETLSKEKVELLLERMARQLTHKIEALAERVEKLETAAKEAPREIPRRESRPEKKQEQGQLRSDPDQMDAEQFSVEKMFYYGNK